MSAPGPPRRAARLLRRLVGHDRHADAIVGDLHEEYVSLAGARGRTVATLWYWGQLLGTGWRYARPDRASLDRVRQDLTGALRGLRRDAGFTVAIVTTLALAIGAGTAIFTVVDTVVLRPLPWERPDELVRVWARNDAEGELNLDLMYQDLEPFEAGVSSFSDVSMLSTAPSTLRDERGEQDEEIVVARTSPDLFRTLGVAPVLGRTYTEEDARAGTRALVISHALWTRRFASDPGVPGRTVHLNETVYDIVGVLPRGVAYPWDADVWRALGPGETEDDDREARIIARLHDVEARPTADAEVDAVAAGLAEARPESHAGLGAWLQPVNTTVVREVGLALRALLGAVGLVLLIACVNTANLLLARASRRSHEVAVRTALGAGRGRIVSLHMTESLLLAVAGGMAGIALGRWLLSLVLLVSPELPRLEDVALDGRVLAVMVAVTALCGVLFGVGPALHAARTPPGRSLRDASRRSTSGRGRQTAQSGLVAAEVALSTVLAFLGLLLFSTFQRALTFDRGLELDGLATVVVDPMHPPADGDARRAYFGEILDRVERLPGVRAAAFTSHDVLEPRGFRVGVAVEGRPVPEPTPQAWVNIVSPEYFRTAGIPVRTGSGFSETAVADGETELVVSERFADLHLPTDPVGARLELDWLSGTVVGVVGDVRYLVSEPALPKVYVSLEQTLVPAGLALTFRTVGDPVPLLTPVEDEIRAAGAEVYIEEAWLAEDEVGASVAPQRFNMILVVSFALLALSLAAVGIHGVTALTVTDRRGEIGIRRALGASNGRVASEVATRMARVTTIGILAGLVGALFGGRLLAGLLVGVTPHDPLLLGGVVVILAATAAVASAVPLARAVRIDPNEALRAD